MSKEFIVKIPEFKDGLLLFNRVVVLLRNFFPLAEKLLVAEMIKIATNLKKNKLGAILVLLFALATHFWLGFFSSILFLLFFLSMRFGWEDKIFNFLAIGLLVSYPFFFLADRMVLACSFCSAETSGVAVQTVTPIPT